MARQTPSLGALADQVAPDTQTAIDAAAFAKKQAARAEKGARPDRRGGEGILGARGRTVERAREVVGTALEPPRADRAV